MLEGKDLSKCALSHGRHARGYTKPSIHLIGVSSATAAKPADCAEGDERQNPITGTWEQGNGVS